ncbi:MAG: zinc ribbon domain-containing protein [Candidatus Omnitrophica bacterium]|nr:zinc ribbon domain-containing protein [Candidatus Omnitrophota bacterium]
MPTYEYECAACGHALEALQSMTEPKLTKCPQCGKNKLARLIGSGSGVIFKGSGFYETDYKQKSSGKSDSKKGAPSCANSASCPMKASGSCSA